MRKNAGINILRMILRKIQDNTEDTEKLEVSLKTLSKYKMTNADFLCKSNGLKILVFTAKHHKNNPVILKLIIPILKRYLSKANGIDASKSACRMCRDYYIHGDLIEIIISKRYLLQDYEMIREAIQLLGTIVNLGNNWDIQLDCDEFKRECTEKQMHLAAISAMLAYKDNEEICEAGIFLIYWLQFGVDGYVQRIVCSQTLRIAIDAGLDEFDRKLDLSERKEIEKVLNMPSVLSAFRQDPIMGVLRSAWERHKDTNQNIAKCGEIVQISVVVRYRRDCKFLKCSNCEKNLPKKKERLLCSSCRLVIYCSSRCQKKHWKQEHKLKCKQATDSTRE